MSQWRLSDFDYHLPEDLIAQYPLPERSQSRLLCLNPNSKEIRHLHFYDLVNLLQPNDLLVFNNSRVIPARLFTHKATGGKVEVLLEKILSKNEILAHVGSNKKLKEGSVLHVNSCIELTYIKRENNLFLLRFPAHISALEVFEQYGCMPLPPYMHREEEQNDKERYQTIYAKHQGSVAAPTAGLHFDQALLDKLTAKGIQFAYVTLHVGSGTFLPVRTENIAEHQMHSEIAEVPEATCEKIRQTKAKGGRVIAVGTTAARSLETASLSGELKPFQGETTIFIYPGIKIHCIDALITNFHLPQSTLLMLVSALAGRETILNAYETAIKERYRFFSYGDAMFIEEKSFLTSSCNKGPNF